MVSSDAPVLHYSISPSYLFSLCLLDKLFIITPHRHSLQSLSESEWKPGLETAGVVLESQSQESLWFSSRQTDLADCRSVAVPNNKPFIHYRVAPEVCCVLGPSQTLTGQVSGQPVSSSRERQVRIVILGSVRSTLQYSFYTTVVTWFQYIFHSRRYCPKCHTSLFCQVLVSENVQLKLKNKLLWR